jgi:hypothetical protein
LLLVGHFENICSDRALIASSQLRLDILYFLDYKLGERLPCHSTISRTRKRLPVALFETLFEKIVQKCIESGMVEGKSQAIDGAFVQANASLDKLESKLVMQWKPLQGETTAEKVSTHISQTSPFSLVEKTAKPRKPDRSITLYQSKTDPQARLAQKRGSPLVYTTSPAWLSIHRMCFAIRSSCNYPYPS